MMVQEMARRVLDLHQKPHQWHEPIPEYVNGDLEMTNSRRVVFAADLGGTHLRAAVVDEQGKIHFRIKHATPKAKQPEEIVCVIVAAARACEAESKKNGRSIRAGSIVVPGTIDARNEVVVQVPNVACLDDFPLKASLEVELGWRINLENDANAAAVGEMWQGAARGFSRVICVTLGTGVGGGIILDGKLWRGVDGSAGEIGHISIDPFSSLVCKCGNTGCLELFASATAIVRMAGEGLPNYPNSVLHGENLTAEKIHDAALNADELSLAVFKKMGTYLGIGLASLVNLLNPEIIVVGGGVASGWSLFAQHMQQEMVKRAFQRPARSVRIVPAECGDDAGLLGAARLALDCEVLRRDSQSSSESSSHLDSS
jgi:glucokinase